MTIDDTPRIVGGGAKKVLYTLETLRRIGVGKAAKALTSKNACKACAYGMGGQNGGMTNELGEFPSVCNKSVQAQSTDIQPAIPDGIFEHPIAELAETERPGDGEAGPAQYADLQVEGRRPLSPGELELGDRIRS